MKANQIHSLKWLLCITITLIIHQFISAQYNTKLGYKAGGIDTMGHKNVMVGAHAGEANDGSGNIFIGNQAGQNVTGSTSNLLIITNDTTKNTIYGDLKKQRVAIGTKLFPTDTTYRLAVEGKIIAREYKATQTMPWPDYVFDDKYSLSPLKDVETFILEHNHLPDIPSAEQVNINGIELASFNALLLKKIEELTIYLINQEKSINDMQVEINHLKSQLHIDQKSIKSKSE